MQPMHARVVKNLVLVTLIVAVPILGGAVAGILLDRNLSTTPIFMFAGMLLGGVMTVLGVAWLVRADRQANERERADGP